MGQHEKDEDLEQVLSEVNKLLLPTEDNILDSYDSPDFPVVFIMGAARSGTTLSLQWLAETGFFSYPTNILSRFYNAPYIGAKIQLMLTKYDYNNEIAKSFNENISYESELGKTIGALAPHEFWYFWRRFFNFSEIQKLTKDELKDVNYQQFISELAALEDVFKKPLVMKGAIANWHIPYIEKILDKVIFIHVKRDPLYQIQSLLQAREKYYGDKNSWYSFKPPEYEFLKEMNPYEQVAGQIYYTNQAIEKGFEKVNKNKFITLEYEKFCQSPADYFEIIKDKLNSQGIEFDKSYNGPTNFNSTNKIKSAEDEIEKMEKAYQNITGTNID